MTLQGVVTASAAAERAVDVAVTMLGALIVGFLALEALYLVACVLYLGCARGRRAVPDQGTTAAGAETPVATPRRARPSWQTEEAGTNVPASVATAP
ncbi:MAG: hypothetical protein OER89_10625 [Gemmatimonadota bacterium]|nr:hypothetical protein [Gemmatimonadota bacterium]